MLTRLHEADLLRNQVLCTLPGGSFVYIVLDGDTLETIIKTNLFTQDTNQTAIYMNAILNDPRNFLFAANQILYAGQILYIPKRIA